MSLKDDLLNLNKAYKQTVTENNLKIFKEVSQLCKSAASEGNSSVTMKRELLPYGVIILLEQEGLLVRQYNTEYEISWE